MPSVSAVVEVDSPSTTPLLDADTTQAGALACVLPNVSVQLVVDTPEPTVIVP